MQNKIDQLTDIINSLKSERQKSFALKLIVDIIDTINNISKNNESLTERKFEIKPGEGETELDKYISLLAIYGFSQEQIAIIEKPTLDFVLKNKDQLTRVPLYSQLLKIHHFRLMFLFENEREPNDLEELKQFIIDATENKHTG